MLPLRISVEGFMSYRDRTTFDFEGARLWMLSGANGAGKSTVFDALRWVLFGVHRAGKQKPEQLIHHEATRLLVEVELELGDEVYKLKRTLGREGARPTWDVARRGADAWESVAGTSMANEYNRWIESHLGLTDEAFCASVYLSQGRADAILNADADARYELLSQLVDLEIYERWHERADERRSEARSQMVEARRRWELAPSHGPECLEELRAKEKQLENELAEIIQRVRALEGARAEATRWEQWHSKLAELEAKWNQVRTVLQDESAIERDFARLKTLHSQRNVVEQLWQAWERRLDIEKQIIELKPQLEQAQQGLSLAEEHSSRAQSAVDAAQKAANEANTVWSHTISQSAELASGRAAIERRTDLLAQKSEHAARLARCEDDANARFENAQRERDRAKEAAQLFPLWQRFEAAQRGFKTAQQQNDEWTQRHDQASRLQQQRQEDLIEVRATLQAATAELSSAKEEVAKVEERERALATRRADFARVEEDSRCHFCGQELSPQHRAAELERLQRAAQKIAQEKTEAHAVRAAALKQHEAASATEQQAAQALSEATNNAAEAAREVRHQSDSAIREHAAARAAWEEIGEEARIRWGLGGGPLPVLDLGSFEFPTTGALTGLNEFAQKVGITEKETEIWRQKVQERSQVQAEIARLDLELAPLLNRWSDSEVEKWLAKATQIETEKESAQRLRDQMQAQLGAARTEANSATRGERAAHTRAGELARQMGPLEGQEIAAITVLQESQAAFDAALNREDELPPSHEYLRQLRFDREQEMNHLQTANIEGRHTALIESRGQLVTIERDQVFYSAQIDSLSSFSRRPRAHVEAEWQTTVTQQQQLGSEREEAGDTVRRLEREEKERGALAVQLQQRTLQYERWEELAHLLGPHQLQRHLLREAERAIVREANGILETISGGTLRLELVPDSDETSGNRKPKVLDVVCYHLTGHEEPQAIIPAFLSGSQRFRVAVALALGIGRTAARGSGNGRAARVETILIDEGFGALDKTGRDEMKDELRELGRELGRVILVSHQEDFANAFPNRFNITMENGVSKVQKVIE